MDWLTVLYPWIKTLHIVAAISWMAGLLYLPRLFAYHADAKDETAETFKVMERRLLRFIMNPAMIAAYVFGLALLAVPGIVDWGAAWIYVKLVGIVALTVVHHMFAAYRKTFMANANRRPARFYKLMNEVPTVLMIVIVAMVVAKPF